MSLITHQTIMLENLFKQTISFFNCMFAMNDITMNEAIF